MLKGFKKDLVNLKEGDFFVIAAVKPDEDGNIFEEDLEVIVLDNQEAKDLAENGLMEIVDFDGEDAIKLPQGLVYSTSCVDVEAMQEEVGDISRERVAREYKDYIIERNTIDGIEALASLLGIEL